MKVGVVAAGLAVAASLKTSVEEALADEGTVVADIDNWPYPQKWLNDEEGGKCANLSYANLSYANLSSANLSYANLPQGCKIYSVSRCGSARRMTTFRVDTDEIWCGCFKGTLEEFKSKCKSTYASDEKYGIEYAGVIAFFEAMKGTNK